MTKGVAGTKAPHGTATRYQAHGCRCDSCRVAWREAGRIYYGRRPREIVDAERAAQHGTESKYSSGCRCDDCRAASRDARARRRSNGGTG